MPITHADRHSPWRGSAAIDRTKATFPILSAKFPFMWQGGQRALISRLRQLTCFLHSEICRSSDHAFPGGSCRYLYSSCALSRRASPTTALAPCTDILTESSKNEEPSNPEASGRPVFQRRGDQPHGSLGCCHPAKVSRDVEV